MRALLFNPASVVGIVASLWQRLIPNGSAGFDVDRLDIELMSDTAPVKNLYVIDALERVLWMEIAKRKQMQSPDAYTKLGALVHELDSHLREVVRMTGKAGPLINPLTLLDMFVEASSGFDVQMLTGMDREIAEGAFDIFGDRVKALAGQLNYLRGFLLSDFIQAIDLEHVYAYYHALQHRLNGAGRDALAGPFGGVQLLNIAETVHSLNLSYGRAQLSFPEHPIPCHIPVALRDIRMVGFSHHNLPLTIGGANYSGYSYLAFNWDDKPPRDELILRDIRAARTLLRLRERKSCLDFGYSEEALQISGAYDHNDFLSLFPDEIELLRDDTNVYTLCLGMLVIDFIRDDKFGLDEAIMRTQEMLSNVIGSRLTRLTTKISRARTRSCYR